MSYEGWYRMIALYNAAEDAYGNGQHRHAAELFRQATALVEAHDIIPEWYRGMTLRARADELIVLERLREALDVLSALPKADAEGFKSCCVYGNLTDHIRVGQELPVSLRTLERAYEQAESYFKGAGDPTWRSRLLHYRSELLALRGDFPRALAVAQEGFAAWKKDCPKLHATTHLQNLFDISVVLGDAERAERYVKLWAEYNEKEEKRSRVRQATECIMRSRLERLRGRPAEAVQYARSAAHFLQLADWGWPRVEAIRALVRAYLAAGRPGEARQVLAQLAHLRRSESAHEQYDFHLLRGDCHAACARREAALPPADDELCEHFGASSSAVAAAGASPHGGATTADRHARVGVNVSASRAARRALAKARAAYADALEVGARIDEKLECDLRRRTVAERLARASRLERAAC